MVLSRRPPYTVTDQLPRTIARRCRRPSWFRIVRVGLLWIDKSRGSQVLHEVLGAEFEGVLSCDYFGAYRKYMRELDLRVQFCLAHLIRDVKYLTTLSHKPTKACGRRLLKTIREMFRTIHRTDELSERTVERRSGPLGKRSSPKRQNGLPGRARLETWRSGFQKHGHAFFEFITTSGVDPTNNLSAPAIRFVVLDCRVMQGTRSEKRRAWSECIWTSIATCEQIGRDLMQFPQDSLSAHWQSLPPRPPCPPRHDPYS